MVAVFNKELLSWYLMTLKLRETVESGIRRTSASNGLLELPDHQKLQQLKDQQQTPSHSNIVIKDGDGGYQRVIPIEEKLNQASQDHAAATWGKLSIYKVPQHLREGDYDHKAYVPQIVSLGPYHHGKDHLQQMDCHKLRFLHVVLKRTNQDIKVYIHSMRELEEKARACYEGPIGLSSNEFVEMMILDGCFVLELFQGDALGFTKLGYPPNDPVFAMRGSMHSIQRDMLMLENQLPLFILDRLLELQFGNPDQKGRVSKLALGFFDQLMPTDEPLTKFQKKLEKTTFDPLSDQGIHCLDVFRTSLLRSGPQAQPVLPSRFWINRWLRAKRLEGQPTIHGVTELREAGIKFKKRETDCFLDIKFKNGILSIPRLFIHNGTKSLFLNLIAFEQSHLDCSNDITSYVIFMDNLINSPEDVSYLHYRHIIKHWLGSDTEVAELFNCLCQEVAFTNNNSYLSQLSKEINQYCDRKWNARCASLRHNYFNSPWAIISFVAAVVLLLLTSAQAFYAVFSYHRPRS
ncbi:hypothetical protein EZV62_013952 [Acer yangbiense]|uniref:Uncharacterized protein n=1 Tax=Acer yangbiense TaxID=1000413 RepID=A0A5C7HRH6_9ROSI|nr:hypothetical protein EZV62_013952 [Acer yangbiense]